MTDNIHQVQFDKVIQSKNYSAFILEANKKKFAIYALPSVGLHIEHILDNTQKRPQTHDFLESLLQGFDIELRKVYLCDVIDNVYYSKIFLSKKSQEKEEIIEIDARPSDSLLLALKHDVDVICSDKVLSQTPEFYE